ncbi:unnamed protein product [Durusdinium trenchii]|uniref:Fucosyltransferase n=1 Tax=Durusdinium trenchii TaxID=1381693 RepID=A0ABP0HST1_9DINO
MSMLVKRLCSCSLLFQQTWHGLYADYINVADEVLLPRIRTAEPWETASEIGRYRWRSRFCSNAGIVELTDLDGTSADDTTVGRLKGLALKGAEAHEVPLISVASAVVEHWEVLQELRAWHVGSFAAHLALRKGGLRVLHGESLEEVRLKYEDSPWRQRLLVDDTIDPWLGGVSFLLGSRVKATLWDMVRSDEVLIAPCRRPDAGTTVGIVYFPEGCYYLLQKSTATRPPGFFATHHRRPARVLVPSFRELGDHGVGVGNALFTLAAAMSLAADHNLSFRLPVSISWFRYSEDGGIFSELPSSFWYTSLNDMDQIVGSPSHMRYAEPQVRSDARKVVVHGYFQEIRYFHHHFPVLTSILFPPSLDAQARSAWSSRQPRMPQRTHTEAIQHLAVHVRFNHGGRLSTSYFQEAIRIAKEQLSIARMGCVFFTNEPKKLQRRWKTKVCGKDHATFNDLSLRDDVVLAVMAICCAGIVLSNSTFSWWAAIFGGYKVVLAPEMSGDGPFRLGRAAGWTQIGPKGVQRWIFCAT